MNQTYYAMKRYLGGEKWTRRDKLTWHYWPVPGCNGHRDLIGKRRGEILFEHFCNRPQASHGLYWRTHPQEYEAFLSHIKK